MQRVMLAATSFLVKGMRFGLSRAMRLDRYARTHFDQQAHNQSVIRSTQKYNMYAAPDEGYYAEQYWRRITSFLQEDAISPEGSFLDLGCGQGRISIPLAKWCAGKGKVVGVDLSSSAIEQAKQYAKEANVNNIDFMAADLFDYLRTVPDHSFDGVFLLEVVFFLPNYQQALAEIVRILKPGALFVGSFRPQYFNLLYAIQNGLWETIDQLLEERTGSILGGHTIFNWHTADELKRMLTEQFHLSVKQLSAIGVCSGIPGDPHAHIVQPSVLSQVEKEKLMRAEEQLSRQLPEAGRYILVAAQVHH